MAHTADATPTTPNDSSSRCARNGYIIVGSIAVKSTAKCPRATVATQRRAALKTEICRPSRKYATAGASGRDGTFESRARRTPAAH